MTLVILTGGIDLSVGAVAGVCGMIAGALLTVGIPIGGGNLLFLNVYEVFIVVAIAGIAIGLVNGTLITKLGWRHLSALWGQCMWPVVRRC